MKKILLVIVIVVVIALAFYFAKPLFVDDVVEEPLPELSGEVSLEEFDSAFELPTAEEVSAMSEQEKQAVEEKLLLQAQTMEVVSEERMVEVLKENFPNVFAQGSFINADSFHKGSGQVKIIQLSEDESIARLENFSVTNGPDLFVYLTKNANPTSSADVKQGFVNLGRLKGNKGNQNYAIPNDIDISEYKAVVIYCKAFSVLFSPASLS